MNETGFSAHYMLLHNDGLYEDNLQLITPLLASLTSVSRVLWLNQLPSVDKYSETGSFNTLIHADKLEKYNKVARSLFQ